MNSDAPQGSVKCRIVPLIALAGAALFLCALCSTASAALKPVSADGRIHSCYKVKGKAKGSLRVVAPRRKCPKGWRKLAWTASSPASTNTSAPSGNGTNGANGTAGELEARIASLSLQVKGLESLLAGVTNTDLLKLVGSLPVLDSVCDQVSGLTTGLDSVNEGIKDLTVLGLVGLSLGNLGALPTNLLNTYSCPSS